MTRAFEPRIASPWPMPHLEPRMAVVQALGWSPADAHWLALVCLYSGVFTRLQYRDWHHRDKYAASRFVQHLTAAGVVREHPLPERRTPQRFCHVFGRTLYRALGIENAHQRRLGSTALLWRCLLTLDCLLAYPDANWLATGAEKSDPSEGKLLTGVGPVSRFPRIYRRLDDVCRRRAGQAFEGAVRSCRCWLPSSTAPALLYLVLHRHVFRQVLAVPDAPVIAIAEAGL